MRERAVHRAATRRGIRRIVGSGPDDEGRTPGPGADVFLFPKVSA
jgi:hypothetical protein